MPETLTPPDPKQCQYHEGYEDGAATETPELKLLRELEKEVRKWLGDGPLDVENGMIEVLDRLEALRRTESDQRDRL